MDNQNKLDITTLKSEIKLPDFKEIEVVSYSNYFDNFWDSLKVEQYNETLISTVLQMNEINNQINEYTQKKVKTELEYKHKLRYHILTVEAANATEKKILAELACEKLEARLAYLSEIIRELTQKANQLRLELDTLKTIGFNIRQEMKL